MNEEEIIKLIEGRIQKLKETRDTLETYSTKTKYNFIIGELQNLLLDINESK